MFHSRSIRILTVHAVAIYHYALASSNAANSTGRMSISFDLWHTSLMPPKFNPWHIHDSLLALLSLVDGCSTKPIFKPMDWLEVSRNGTASKRYAFPSFKQC